MQEKPGEREGDQRERGRKGERRKKEEGGKAEEEGDKQVKKDVTGWTVVEGGVARRQSPGDPEYGGWR